jgi:hypothetical protein
LIAVTVTSVTIRYNSFIPWGTDSGAYVTAAHDWARADLFHPQTLVYRFPWAETDVESPFGHRRGETRGTYTGIYPLGYPLLLAAALKLGGELAPYVVAPIFAGVLAWCAFLLGRALATAWAGVLAAAFIGASPVTLGLAVMPMSDVPATAFWAISWLMSLRVGHGAAMAAGACTAMAVMIRPNLAPLAIVVAASVAASQRERLSHVSARLAIYGLTAALGPAVLMWSQAVLYGGPFNSGYGVAAEFFFSAERIPQNAYGYVEKFTGLHTSLPLAGLLTLPVMIVLARRRQASRAQVSIALAAAAIIAINYAFYLPYLSFPDWQSLRFMLPAMLDWLRLVIARYRWWAAPLAVVPMYWVLVTPYNEIRAMLFQAGLHIRLELMGRYLRAALPPNAVILTYLHSGAVAFYTGKPIIRTDTIGATALDRIVADLRRGGFSPALVFDLAYEYAPLEEKFRSSPLLKLDWQPRAEFATLLGAYYYDIAARERFLSGDGDVVDDVLWNGARRHEPPLLGVRPPGERFVLPGLEETAAFRTLLERTYRTDLHRAESATRLDARTATLWTRRYLRYRLHGCNHAVALTKIFEQVNGGGAQALCARPADAIFPPRDETVDFRRQLDAKYPMPGHLPSVSSVDIEGEAVWLQEYLQHRIANCSHGEAAEAVRQQIAGGPPRACGGK